MVGEKRWKKAVVCIAQIGPQQHKVKTENGNLFIRNRKYLVVTKENFT